MSEVRNQHFRRLCVESFDPRPFIAGFGGDSEDVDVSSFVKERYKVTFEYRTSRWRKWRKVVAYT